MAFKKSLLFGGGRKGGISLTGNFIPTFFPSSWRDFKNSPLTFSSPDGKPAQWTIICQNAPTDVAAGRFNSIVGVQQFSGATSFAFAPVDPNNGEPLILPSVTSFTAGVVSRLGSIFRAYGERIQIFPYANQFAGGLLSIGAAPFEITPHSENVRSDTTAGPVAIPYMATHVSVNTIAGNLEIRNQAGAAIDIIVAPVAGVYYSLPPNAASVVNTGAAADYVFSFRING